MFKNSGKTSKTTVLPIFLGTRTSYRDPLTLTLR